MIELVTAKSDSEALQVNAVLEKHQQSHQTNFNDFNISLCENSEVVTRGVLKKGVYKNFAKFTGKLLSQSFFLVKLQALQLY